MSETASLDVTAITTNLTGLLAENVLYGFYLGIFWPCVLRLRRTYSGSGGCWKGRALLIKLAYVLFVLITAHWGFILSMEIYHIRWQIIHSYHTDPTSSTFRAYADLALAAIAVERTIGTLQLVVADLVLIHRLYYICGRSRRLCILPMCLSAVTISTGFASIGFNYKQNDSRSLIILEQIIGRSWFRHNYPDADTSTMTTADASWILTWAHIGSVIVTQLYCTTLTCSRLLRNHRALKRLQAEEPKLAALFPLLIESSSIFVACTISILIVVSIPSLREVVIPLILPSSPAIGIGLTLMLSRMHLRTASAESSSCRGVQTLSGDECRTVEMCDVSTSIVESRRSGCSVHLSTTKSRISTLETETRTAATLRTPPAPTESPPVSPV